MVLVHTDRKSPWPRQAPVSRAADLWRLPSGSSRGWTCPEGGCRWPWLSSLPGPWWACWGAGPRGVRMTLREGTTWLRSGTGPAHAGEWARGPAQDSGDCRKSRWESPAVSGQSSRCLRPPGCRGSRPGQEEPPGPGRSPQAQPSPVSCRLPWLRACFSGGRPAPPAAACLPRRPRWVWGGDGACWPCGVGGTPPSTCRSFLSSQQVGPVPSGDFSGTCPHPQSRCEAVSPSLVTAGGSPGRSLTQTHKAGCLPPGSPG